VATDGARFGGIAPMNSGDGAGSLPPRNLTLPAGWVAEVVTYLEMLEPPPPRPAAEAGGMSIQRIQPDATGYRDRFRRVGEPWLWASRLRLGDDALMAILATPEVEIYDLRIGPDSIGLLELDFRQDGACELTFFGVVLEAIGIGAGRFLMNRAIERAWSRTPRIGRFWVHTCTNDHPDALAFYIRSGFVPYARGIECYPDPRIEGLLKREAAPQIPVI
jgi:GNAT superfamily N-acetyltransferase